jgi:hypothetical protein
MIKIRFPFGGGVTTLREMWAVQAQFRASTGMCLSFDGWASYDIALFRVTSHFI